MKRMSQLIVAAGLVLGLTSLRAAAQTDDAKPKSPPAEEKKAADPTAPAGPAVPADGTAPKVTITPAGQPAEPTADAPLGDLPTEISQLKREVQGMRADMRAILRELTMLKQAQAAAKPAVQQARPAQELLGKAAPEATFKTTSNQELKIGGKQDKVQVAIFYASWCGYCKRALPNFEKLKKEYEGKDVQFMAISLDAKEGQRSKTEPELIAAFQELGMASLPMHWDPDKKIGNQYKVQSFPTSFVIGKNGLVEAVHIGGPADLDKTIKTQVDKLLAGESLVKAAPTEAKG
jgi:thiol-disulfide isomerase/thioredoxin